MYEAVLTSQQSDNTTAYSTISGLSLTPASGTYLVVVVVPISSGAANYTYLGLAVDGTDIATSEREHYHESSIWGQGYAVGHYTAEIITVDGSEAIQARWKSSTEVLRYADEGSIQAIKLETGEGTQVASSSDTTGIAATPVKVTDFGTPGADEYLIIWTGSFRCGATAETAHVAIYVNDTEVAHTERRFYCEGSLSSTTSYPLMIAAVVNPGAGEEVSVRAWRTGSNDATCHERTGIRIKDRVLHQASATASDTDSGTTDVLIDSLQIDNPGAGGVGDYLAIVSWVNSYGTMSAHGYTTSTFYTLGVGKLTNSDKEFCWEDSLDNMDLGVANAMKFNVPDAVKDVQARWRGGDTQTRTAEERTFVLMYDTPPVVTREQEGFRFRDDDGDEDEATWLASQDTNISRVKGQTTRLRILTDTAGANPPSEGLQLEYKRVADATTEWRKVPTS